MSGVVKSIKKVFKSVSNAVQKLWHNKIVRAIVIAAAIYFTGGLAAGAMGSASAAAMPGIAAAAETMGVTAGAFSTAAAGAATEGVAAGVAGEMALDTAAASAPAATTEGLLSTAAPSAGAAGAEIAPTVGEVIGGSEVAPVAATEAGETIAGQTVADTAAGSTVAENAPSWVPKWFSDLPAPAQQMVGNAVVEGAKATYGAYAVSEAEKEKERQRAQFQNNQQPVVLTWNGAPAYQGGPKDAQAGGGMLDQAQPQATQPQAVPPPQTPVTQEIGRAATGVTPTATQRFAAPAPVSADEIERQRRLKTFQGGGMLSQART